MRLIRSHEGDSVDRSAAAIFEGGAVWGRALTPDGASSELNVSLVQFAPGAWARWHRHTSDQVLYVVSGIGKVGDRAGEHVISSGDCAVIPAGEEHWHGAHDTGSPMAHLSITAAGNETTVLDG